MHFLLVPYALLSLTFALQYQGRHEGSARGGIFVTSTVTGIVLFLAMLLRPLQGDSWRYYQYFLVLRYQDLEGALEVHGWGEDALFAGLVWAAGRMGSSEMLLFGSTLVVFFSVFMMSLRRLLSAVDAAALFMCYIAFPFFIAYAVNGLRQGLAVAFLMMALTQFSRGRRSAWLWLFLAPHWHGGSWIAVIIVLVHRLMTSTVRSDRLRWLIVFSAFGSSVLLSASGLNETLLGQLPDAIDIQDRHQIYFTDPEEIQYRAGFRADFFLFSLLPLVSAFMLRRSAATFAYAASGGWLSIYVSLNIAYHLFSFVPFADRFAGFSWFLMPLVVFHQVRETNSPRLMTGFMGAVAVVNIVMLQFYTGTFIRAIEF